MHLRKTKKCTVEIKNKDENRSLFYGIITISHVKISIYNLIHHSVSILLAYTPPPLSHELYTCRQAYKTCKIIHREKYTHFTSLYISKHSYSNRHSITHQPINTITVHTKKKKIKKNGPILKDVQK